MVTLVVGLNCCIAIACWYVVWQVWQLRKTLSNVAEALIAAEQNTHNVLYGAPTNILNGQQGIHQLRQSYQRLELQLQKLQRIVKIFNAGWGVWQRQSVNRRQRRSRWARSLQTARRF
jgi:hypothetical protein